MRITKLYVLLMSLCCFSLTTFAQTNFLPGYYVDDLGDTTRGFIEYRSRESMSHFIRFRRTERSIPRKLNPENIVVVSINDQNEYVSFTYTPYSGEPFAGFFKKIISGHITLYRYRDRYFVVKEGDQIREITKTVKRVNTDLIGDDYSGFGMLRSMINDCSSIDEQFLLDNYLPKNPDYKRIINKYNECFPEGTHEIEDIVVKSHVDFGVQGNLNWATPNFRQTDNMSEADFGWRHSASGGALVSLFTHHMGDRLRFNVEPSVGSFYGYSYFQNDDGMNDVHLRFKFFRMPTYFRIYLRYGLFVDLGLSNMITFDRQSSWRIEAVKDLNHNYLFSSDGPPYKVKSGMAGLAGFGGRFEIRGIPFFITARASSIFRPLKDLTATQPIYQWVDLGLAIQITGK